MDKKPYKKHNRSGGKPYKSNGPRRKMPPKTKLRANIWGLHAVREAWLNPKREILSFYATETALKKFQETLDEAAAQNIKRPAPQILEKHTLNRSLSDAVHQGLAIEAEDLEETFIQDVIHRCANQDRAILMILDQVTDPHNVGAIMRSASAFGAEAIIMQSRYAPSIDGVLAKTACGGAEHITVCYETNLNRAIVTLQENGFTVIGLDERGTLEINDYEVPDKIAFVLGAEGKGMRQSLRENCDTLVRLPTKGAIQSLNVSNAAAVTLYALIK